MVFLKRFMNLLFYDWNLELFFTQNEYYEIAELINKTAEMKNCDFSCPQSETSRAHFISRSSWSWFGISTLIILILHSSI